MRIRPLEHVGEIARLFGLANVMYVARILLGRLCLKVAGRKVSTAGLAVNAPVLAHLKGWGWYNGFMFKMWCIRR